MVDVYLIEDVNSCVVLKQYLENFNMALFTRNQQR